MRERSGSVSHRPVMNNSENIRIVCNSFLNEKMSNIDKDTYLDASEKLKKMVAYATFIFGKNADFLTPAAMLPPLNLSNSISSMNSRESRQSKEEKKRRRSSVASPNLSSAASEAVAEARPRRNSSLVGINTRERRGSLDMRRTKIVESGASKSTLPKGVLSVAELEFALSLCQHIMTLVPKDRGAAVLTQQVRHNESRYCFCCSSFEQRLRLDEQMISKYYEWFNRTIPTLRLQDNRLTMRSNKKANKLLGVLKSPKNSSRLPHAVSLPLNVLIKRPDLESEDCPAWMPNEVSDAIACVYEYLYDQYDNEVTFEIDLPHALSNATASYFADVFHASTALYNLNASKFCKGVLNNRDHRDFGCRLTLFAVLAGLVKLDYDIDKVARHPKVAQFGLKVYKSFLPIDTSFEEGAMGALLRTDHRKTMVQCIPKDQVTFRTTVRTLIQNIPKTPFNTEDNQNALLGQVESACSRYKGFYVIDVDFLVMKMVTYFCKCYGGFSWFSVDSIYVQTSSRGSGGRRKSEAVIQALKKDVPEVSNEPLVLPTEEQMAEFRSGRAGELCLTYIGVMMKKIQHRKMVEEEEQRRINEMKEYEEEQVEENKEEFVDLFAEDSKVEEEVKKPKLPLITYPTDNLVRACVNLKERTTREEVSFEEYREWSDAQNRRNSLSLIVRTKINSTFTVRAAPFELVKDVMMRMIDYEIMNNACLKIWEASEWYDFQYAHESFHNASAHHTHTQSHVSYQPIASASAIESVADRIGRLESLREYSLSPPPPGY
ncbi:hypothetical protein TL16_g12274 [Triparma laevis f. inornata]|uniref:Uncharacterized protein n=1 Tax=Triparma laevis f. inornata TaxID=1714386 RepID=A0A9W7BSY7_9STRA|nr:hypothetical protein TL16_g12274 [Triparma laevis f. inornata]